MAGRFQYTAALVVLLGGLCLLSNFVASEEEDDFDDVPVSKLSSNAGVPTLKFFYCYSCGYRRAYEEYVSILQDRYPYLMVDGKNYDPPGFNMMIARVLGLAKMVIIMCILGSINVFAYFNLPQPSWWTWCLENKLYACLMLFFLCNLVEGQLIQSGAFEIMFNDMPVWSKLETGRIPQPNELFQIIDSHMKLPDNILDIGKNKLI